MGSIFSTVKTNMAAKPKVLITSLLLQLDAVPNLKWSCKASRVYVTSNNSVRHYCLSNIHHSIIADEIGSCNNLVSFSDTSVIPNPHY